MKSGSTTKAYIAQSIPRNLLLARGSGIETAKSSTQVSGGSSSSRTKPVPTPDGSGVTSTSDLKSGKTVLEPARPTLPEVRRPVTYSEALRKLRSELPYFTYADISATSSRYVNTATITQIDVTSHGSKYRQVFENVNRGNENLAEGQLKNVPSDVQYRVLMVENLDENAIDLLGETFPIDPDLFAEYLANQMKKHHRFQRKAPQYETPHKFIPRRKRYVSVQWSRVFVHQHQSPASVRSDGKCNEILSRNTIPRPFSRLSMPDCRLRSLNLYDKEVSSDARKLKSEEGKVTSEVYAHYENASMCWFRGSNGCPIVLMFLDSLPEPLDKTYKITSYDHCRGDWDNMAGSNAPVLPTGTVNAATEQDPNEWWGPKMPLSTLHFEWDLKGQRASQVPSPAYNISTREVLENILCSDKLGERFHKGLNDPGKGVMADPSEVVAMILCQLIERDSYFLLSTISEGLQEIHNTLHDSLDDIHRRLPLWQALFVDYREHVLAARRSTGNLITTIEALSTAQAYRDICSLTIARHPGHRSAKLFAGEGNPHPAEKKYPELYADLQTSFEQVDSVYAEIQETANSVMSTMSIIESERAIDEAEGVTKLTELAFLFVPLSFSATIFGMQVEEFQGKITIITWVITAVAIVSASYALRLTVRSRLISRLKQRMMSEVRKTAGLNPGDNVPLLTFLGHHATKLTMLEAEIDESEKPKDQTPAGVFLIVSLLVLAATIVILASHNPLQWQARIALSCGIGLSWLVVLSMSVVFSSRSGAEGDKFSATQGELMRPIADSPMEPGRLGYNPNANNSSTGVTQQLLESKRQSRVSRV